MFAVILSAFLVCLKGLTNYSLPRAKFILSVKRILKALEFNSKIQLVQNLVFFPFEVPFSLNNKPIFGLNTLKALKKNKVACDVTCQTYGASLCACLFYILFVFSFVRACLSEVAYKLMCYRQNP